MAQRNTRGSRGERPRREPLYDNYYYEEPARRGSSSRSRVQGQAPRRDTFEDISSYSSRAAERKHRNEQKKYREKSKKPAVAALVLVLLLIGAGVFFVYGYLLKGLTFRQINKDQLGIQKSEAGGVKNIALFGLDAREDENEGRSDALIVLSVDSKRGKLKMTSVLRDSEVEIEGYGSDKITHAYAYGGPELAIHTLNQNFGLDIEDYVTVNFIQMAKIVDAFGGTRVTISYEEMNEINNNLAMQQAESYDAEILESDYLYEDGEVLLNGNQAVAYARIRHLEGGDDMRAGRQQEVLKGLIQQLKGKSKLEYPGLIHELMPLCETSLDFSDIMGMTPFLLQDFSTETLSIPGEEEDAYGDYNEDGRWVYLYDIEAASEHISRFIYEEDSPYYIPPDSEA